MSAVLKAVRDRCRIDGVHWIWRQSVNNGVPHMWWDGRSQKVRRLVAEAREGSPIPAGLCVSHHCTHRHCVAPRCLRINSRAEAHARASARGAFKRSPARHLLAARTMRAKSKLSQDAVRRIRQSTESIYRVAEAEGISPSYVARLRKNEFRREIASPLDGLGARA